MARQIRLYPHELTDLRQTQTQPVYAEIRKLRAESDKSQDADFMRATRANINQLQKQLEGMHFAFNLIEDKFTVNV